MHSWSETWELLLHGHLQCTGSGSSLWACRAESFATNEAREHAVISAALWLHRFWRHCAIFIWYLPGIAACTTATARSCAEHETDVWMEAKDYAV